MRDHPVFVNGRLQSATDVRLRQAIEAERREIESSSAMARIMSARKAEERNRKVQFKQMIDQLCDRYVATGAEVLLGLIRELVELNKAGWFDTSDPARMDQIWWNVVPRMFRFRP